MSRIKTIIERQFHMVGNAPIDAPKKLVELSLEQTELLDWLHEMYVVSFP